MTVTQARRKNIAKARAALAVKRALKKHELDTVEVRLGTFTPKASPEAEVAVTMQTLQETLDQAGWQLNVLRKRMGGLL